MKSMAVLRVGCAVDSSRQVKSFELEAQCLFPLNLFSRFVAASQRDFKTKNASTEVLVI